MTSRAPQKKTPPETQQVFREPAVTQPATVEQIVLEPPAERLLPAPELLRQLPLSSAGDIDNLVMSPPSDDTPEPPAETRESLSTPCCIVGGGIAGLMLGLLLARAGMQVLLLEQDLTSAPGFVDDVLLPSALQIMDQLGVLSDLLKLPHRESMQIDAQLGPVSQGLTQLPPTTHPPTPILISHHALLSFLIACASRYANFTLRTGTRVINLTHAVGENVGLEAKTPGGFLDVRSNLVIAADGADSLLRAKIGLAVRELAPPIEILWFRISRQPGDPGQGIFRINAGRVLVTINEGAFWRCGLLAAPGEFTGSRVSELTRVRSIVMRVLPFAADRVQEINRWAAVTIQRVHLRQVPNWHRKPVLCVGEAAHPLSPVSGFGATLAIQDAVAAAKLITQPLRTERPHQYDLNHFQRSRALPARMVQWMQEIVHANVESPITDSHVSSFPRPWIRLFARYAPLRWLFRNAMSWALRAEQLG